MCREEILAHLEAMEKKWQIEILYVALLGSRRWDLHHEDSDYDIRCVFRYPIARYLSLTPPPPQLDLKAETPWGDDIVGWDIKKFLTLLQAGNPGAHEWLDSPCLYLDRDFRKRLAPIRPRLQPLPSLIHYYRRMMTSNWTRFFQKKEIVPKKYFYLLQPALMILYLITTQQVHFPRTFLELLEHLSKELEPEVIAEIQDLVTQKKAGALPSTGPHLPRLDSWIREITFWSDLFIEHHLETKVEDWKGFYQMHRDLLETLLSKGNRITTAFFPRFLFFRLWILASERGEAPTWSEMPRTTRELKEWLIRYDQPAEYLEICQANWREETYFQVTDQIRWKLETRITDRKMEDLPTPTPTKTSRIDPPNSAEMDEILLMMLDYEPSTESSEPGYESTPSTLI